MDADTLKLMVMVGGPVVGGVVWLVRLEGRINLTERLQQELKDDLKYIRDRIDAALNGSHK
jgi:sensor domain CHASE-containing protein